MSRASASLRRLHASARRQAQDYSATAPDERPLGGYLAAMGVFGTLMLGTTAVAARRDAGRPDGGLSVRDLVLLGAATHKLSRIITKDAVASPLRAPFTRYVGPAGPGEVTEEVRGRGVRHTVGELLTCPFCLSPWAATTLLAGLTVAPRFTRQVTALFSAVTLADLLQLGYSALEQRSS